jgi:hypothetical protein
VGAIFTPGSHVAHSYTILTAAGGVTGVFTSGATRGVPAGFLPSLSYTGNSVLLNLTAQLVPETPPEFSATLPPVPGLRCARAAAAGFQRQSAQCRPCN